mgnify:CR=1 FL=1
MSEPKDRSYKAISDDAVQLATDAGRYRFIRDHLSQMHSPDMGSQHGWRFRCGWLGGKMRGPTFDEAVDAAMRALANEKLWYEDNPGASDE